MTNMEWGKEIGKVRKMVTGRLAAAGYSYKGQGQWEKPFGFWRGRVDFEVGTRNRGEGRWLLFGVSLVRSQELTPEEAKAQAGYNLSGYRTYAVYSIDFKTEVVPEWWADSPQQMEGIRQEILHDLETVWIPWIEAKQAEHGEDTEGAHRRHESVHGSLDYVP